MSKLTFIASLFALLIVIKLCFGMDANSTPLVEKFGMLPNMTLKSEAVYVGADGNAQAGPSNAYGDNMFTVPGQFQANLSPRQSSVDVAAAVSYSLPSKEYLAFDEEDPLAQASLVPGFESVRHSKHNHKEGFCAACQAQPKMSREGYKSKKMRGSARSARSGESCRLPSGVRKSMRSGVSSQKKIASQIPYSDVTSMLPVGDMTLASSNGDVQQVTTYQRTMYANQRSRLRGEGCRIRGDLPIVPRSNGWFRPSANPERDLCDGALMVIGGPDNESAKQTLALRSMASGDMLSTGAGVSYSVNRQNALSAAGADLGSVVGQHGVQVTSFP
jgi:hypothetical protein